MWNYKNIDYNGEITIDRYGRSVPKHAHGTINLDHKTSSNKLIGWIYDRIIDNRLLTRRINITANNIINEEQAENDSNIINMIPKNKDIRAV